MVIWLSRPREAHASRNATGRRKDEPRVGVASDIVPRETFGMLATIDDVYGRVEAERQAILAAAQIEREKLLQAARDEAAALIASAAREREAAQERGYAEGVVRGEAQWIERIAALSADAQRLQMSMRNRMAELVMLAVEQLVRTESAQALFARATDTIDRIVEGSASLRISVHPADLDAARDAFGEFDARLRLLGRPVPLAVAADPRLAPGACVCESDLGIVDASLSTQLDSMRAAIVRALNTSLKTQGTQAENDS
ncbi:type III secretion system stator protein SctL [Paraburkholderia sp. C35]|uniref:type III secretion system stator protein SctL n=1 Tax=Paraburkholderia sp. C35 TaxID=2126993 RepID=UPI000D69F962|nr:type III secretion system stator protein SctL [Paraburkholderia sp. C35]